MQNGIYRAKRKDNLEWVEGYLYVLAEGTPHRETYILKSLDERETIYDVWKEAYEVIPETVGRLLDEPCWNGDRYGQRFFQNDIIAVWKYKHSPYRGVKPDGVALVVDESTISEDGLGRRFPQDTTSVRIIGNAYDNPELIEGHTMNHFINGLHEYPGDPEDYHKNHRYLTEKYGIHGAQACCYMCNFENEYVCHQYNGGCKRIDVCRKIKETEERAKED